MFEKEFLIKMYAICYFRIFATPWKLLAFFAEVSVFLINYCTDFQKLGTNGKVCCFSMCLHALLVFFFTFNSCSRAFESFSRGIFGLFVLNVFIFSNIKCTNLR